MTLLYKKTSSIHSQITRPQPAPQNPLRAKVNWTDKARISSLLSLQLPMNHPDRRFHDHDAINLGALLLPDLLHQPHNHLKLQASRSRTIRKRLR